MTEFKKVEAGKCKECGEIVYMIVGLHWAYLQYHTVGDDKICIKCFEGNPGKYKEPTKEAKTDGSKAD